MRALIVEDLIIAQKILGKFISNYAECKFAIDGVEGLAAFVKANQNNKPYDVIFLDIMLPRLSGLEVLKKIGSVDSGENSVKIIMMTALSDQKTVSEAIKLGCNGYVTKPFSQNDIETQLKNLKLI